VKERLREWWNKQTEEDKAGYIRGFIISVISLVTAWVICFETL
jgi:hypothetical protein